MPVDMPDELAHRILAHFAANARELPWRNPPGQPLPLHDADWPYRVWLSEVMLQQTTVSAVKPYFVAFTTRWRSVDMLAAARDEDVMSAWAGLGYYARARHLLACARVVSKELGGQFPRAEADLLKLPGIGRYTAAAISAIAFGKRAVVVDGNVERVVARLFAESGKKPLYDLAASITPDNHAGDFAQAMMDLGATVCTPRNPRCDVCPVETFCRGRDKPEAFPAKPVKAARPERSGTAWWIERDGHVLLVTRPSKGLLGGMRALPSSEWSLVPDITPPLPGQWAERGSVTHIFTHFSLTLSVSALTPEGGCNLTLAGEWWPIARIEDAGLPTIFAKAARLAASWEDVE
jgi:A/G-specific adenine glycosylase